MTESTGMLTDRYELTMLETARHAGIAERRAVFEVFARRLPTGRRYGVVAGIRRMVDAIERFGFSGDELEFLLREGIVSETTAAWLSSFAFAGRIDAYGDGELYFPGSPVVVVSGSYGEALILETLLLSILNHDSAVASAASRIRVAAGPTKKLLELGGRRTHESAAISASLAAYIVGFDATSNLAAGHRYGIPSAGTAAHASVLAATTESDAFDQQIAVMGPDTTLLVDTYSIPDGVDNAVAAARRVGAPGPGAIRIDSGNPFVVVPEARTRLDALGATATRIVLSGDLDEQLIARYAALPIDAFGVGTSVVTGSGAPTANFVYKLVAIGDDHGRLRAVAKRSEDKASIGGRKRAFRQLENGQAVAEVAILDGHLEPDEARVLQHRVWDAGSLDQPTLETVRARHRAAMDELGGIHVLEPGPPLLSVEVLPADSKLIQIPERTH